MAKKNTRKPRTVAVVETSEASEAPTEKKHHLDQGKKAEITKQFQANPKASTKDVLATLAAMGMTVSENYVANIKSDMGLTKKRGGKRGRPVGSTNGAPKTSKASTNGHGSALELVRKATDLATAAGSTKAAIELLQAIGGLN